ncbi:MotA/TolQ/ExbB proton channel family protein [Deinococcus roseus]|uniref:Biopolymer transporter n=1 Tax=Deinococcus roseus TaxID=392414 RepID=A0ABQ2CW62_9DEIO|nr:MotA/TolQ/ExbB proton channel family protein [Deinococcus roseus]GGJ26781.1 biopolymer transporter [Deinococcus roseus]
MPLLDMLTAAGPLLWILVLLSFYVVYQIFYRLQVLSKLDPNVKLLQTQVHSALMQNNLAGAIELASQAQQPSGNVMRAGLERLPAGRDASLAAMQNATLLEEDQVYQGINTLGVIAQIAPLLGLLGTVIGMVRSFMVFSQTTAPTPTQLSTGISEALINTAGGLIVAIVAYVGRQMLRNRADTVMLQVDRSREALNSWLEEFRLRQKGVLTGVPLGTYESERKPAKPKVSQA